MTRAEWRGALRSMTAIIFLMAGANHFRRPGLYLRIMPPSIPYPTAMVLISGFFEMAGGMGLLISRLRRPAKTGLILLLLAVCPANVYMATAPQRFEDLHIPQWVLWLRLPLQPILMLWIWWIAKDSIAPRPPAVAPDLPRYEG